MASHTSLKADLKVGLKLVSNGQAVHSAEVTPLHGRGLRRTITREQGAAIEMISHAVDYLTDCYLHEGADDVVLDFSAPEMIAAQILISAQRQILHALPLTEPLTLRLWNALLRRKPRFKSPSVVPLSSSR
jgi:hypothetical protein